MVTLDLYRKVNYCSMQMMKWDLYEWMLWKNTLFIITIPCYGAAVWHTRRKVADVNDQDYHVFGQDDHDFGDGRPGDHHEILLKLWPCLHPTLIDEMFQINLIFSWIGYIYHTCMGSNVPFIPNFCCFRGEKIVYWNAI